MTGVFSRRFLTETLALQHSRAARLGTVFSVCLCDLDHFKAVNDTFGHAAGDAVLKHFALLAVSGLRAVDVFGRYGGEEFLCVLPDTGQPGACVVGERVRVAVEGAVIPEVPAECRITVTIGVATTGKGEEVHAMLARADAGLYRGKDEGRNRVVAVG